MLKPYKKLKSKILVHNKFTTVYEDDFESGNGQLGQYYHEVRGDGVIIVGTTKESKDFILVKEYRFPIEDFAVNVVMGGVKKDEDYKTAALREFHEETGYKSNKELVEIDWWYSQITRTKDRLFLYYLPECEFDSNPDGGEVEEETEVVLLPREKVWSFINNETKIAANIVALTKVCKYLNIN